MSCASSLPPPIRDPSGKIYVAIPAPAFIFAQDTSAEAPAVNSAPGYVYIEYNPNGPHKLPQGLTSSDWSESTEIKLSVSISNWMTNYSASEPPPGHIPWTGEVLPSSPSDSVTSCTEEPSGLKRSDLSLGRSKLANSSISSFEIPSIPTGDTLLNGLLPSTCSSGWSGSFVPPSISQAKFVAKSGKRKSVPANKRKSRSTVKAHTTPDNRRFTICVTSSSKRREAHVFNRRRTPPKTEKIQIADGLRPALASSKSRIMSQIDDLDDFFSEGLKKMDLSMLRLGKEQDKAKTPSLVVSTSSVIRPVSLESSMGSRTGAPSLARRRGKDIPVPLKLDNCSGPAPSCLDYPDIPTAFRGSPEPTSDAFFGVPKYPTLKLDTKMTTEQMICSLREQVQSFYPRLCDSSRNSDAFMCQCRDAEKWLEDELNQSPCKNKAANVHRDSQVPDTDTKCRADGDGAFRDPDDDNSLLPLVFPLPPRQVKDIAHLKTPLIDQSNPCGRVRSLRASVIHLPTDDLKSGSPELVAPKMKPCRSILSNGSVSGSVSSCGSAKKVRFSDDSPSVIPPIEDIVQDASSSATPTRKSLMSSPKRKPVPPIVSIKSPTAMRGSLPTTPTKSAIRKSSPLNPASRTTISSPISRPALECSVKSMHPAASEKSTLASKPHNRSPFKKGPLIFSRAANASAGTETTDNGSELKKLMRPLSVGASLKENRERSFSDKLATITKRRSFMMGGNDSDKENQRGSKLSELVAREVQKKGGRRSLPFQSVLSRLRG